MKREWSTPDEVDTGNYGHGPLILLGIVLALGGTPKEADQVQSLLGPEGLPYLPSGAHVQIRSALDYVRSRSDV